MVVDADLVEGRAILNSDTLVGKTIGPYEIQRELGHGAMGVVYKAVDKTLHRAVALKLLPTKFANEDFINRFQQEARAAAQINHPNVVTIYGVGSDGDHHYIAMELVVGKTLEKEIKVNRSIDMRRALEIVGAVAGGLEAAHRRRIFHRDIKPQNIMVSDRGVPKILDFGIARLSRREGREGKDEGEIFGTPAYMSPEQCKGERADGRSDIFSLGVTLYEMISGRLPFLSKSRHELALMIVEDPHPSIRRYVPGVPQSVVDLLKKMLEKDPKDRFQTATGLQEAIQRVLETLEADIQREKNSGGGITETPMSYRQTPPYPGPGPATAGTPTVGLPVAASDPGSRRVPRPAVPDSGIYGGGSSGSTAPLPVAALGWNDSSARRRRFPLWLPLVVALVLAGAGYAGWSRYSSGERARVSTGAEEVTSTTVTADGRFALTSGSDGVVRGWDLRPLDEPPKLLERFLPPEIPAAGRTIQADKGRLFSLVVAPGGRLVTAGGESDLKVWDLAEAKQVRSLKGHEGGVFAVAVSTSGRVAVSGGQDGRVRIWNLDKGSLLGAMDGHEGIIQGVAISRDGRRVASAGADRTARIWDANSRSAIHVLTGHKDVVSAVEFERDGERVVTGSWDGSLRAWSVSSGKSVNARMAHDGAVRAIAFSSDGKLLASADADGRILVWRGDAAEPERAFSQSAEATCVAFSPDGSRLVSGGSDGRLHVWQLKP